MVNPKNEYKLKLADNLWLTFIDQTQSNVVVFTIFIFRYI